MKSDDFMQQDNAQIGRNVGCGGGLRTKIIKEDILILGGNACNSTMG